MSILQTPKITTHTRSQCIVSGNKHDKNDLLAYVIEESHTQGNTEVMTSSEKPLAGNYEYMASLQRLESQSSGGVKWLPVAANEIIIPLKAKLGSRHLKVTQIWPMLAIS